MNTDVEHVKLWKDGAGEYRFVPVGANGEPLDNGSEGYTRAEDARRAARGLFGEDIRIVEDES